MKRVVVTVCCVVLMSLFMPTDAGAQARGIAADVVNETQPTSTESPSLTPGDSPVDRYVLPYPGMLTSHPLYFLKAFRDWIMERIISEPGKRIEFQVLKSDKFLAMAQTYVQRGEWDRAKDSLLQAQRNKETAVKRSQDMGEALTVHTSDRLYQSLSKHLEIMEDMNSHPRMVTWITSHIAAIRQLKDTAAALN